MIFITQTHNAYRIHRDCSWSIACKHEDDTKTKNEDNIKKEEKLNPKIEDNLKNERITIMKTTIG